MANDKYGWQVTRLRSNQADKCLGLQEWPTSVKPTSNQADKYPGRQVPSQYQRTNISISFALGTDTLHLAKEQILINGARITWQRGDHTPSLCKKLDIFPLTHGVKEQSYLVQKRLHALPLTLCRTTTLCREDYTSSL